MNSCPVAHDTNTRTSSRGVAPLGRLSQRWAVSGAHAACLSRARLTVRSSRKQRLHVQFEGCGWVLDSPILEHLGVKLAQDSSLPFSDQDQSRSSFQEAPVVELGDSAMQTEVQEETVHAGLGLCE